MNMQEQMSELNKSIELLNIEMENNRKTKSINDPEYVSDDYMKKIKSILSNLENYNFHNYTVRNEIQSLYSIVKDCSIKETIILGTMLTIAKLNKKENKNNFFTYNEVLGNDIFEKINKIEDNELSKDSIKQIFVSVEKICHKILHLEKNENNIKICEIYEDINDIECKIDERNEGYKDIEYSIIKLKEKLPEIEFIGFKIIIIALINLTQELLKNYNKSIEESNSNLNNDLKEKEKNNKDNTEIKTREINPKLFERIFIDYAFINNKCPILENYFIQTIKNFKYKYSYSVTLSDLFTDIFWNIIFHDKNICQKYVNLYIGKDSCEENTTKIIRQILKILNDIKFPFNSQITEVLFLNKIELFDKDIISSILTQKSINHDLIQKEALLNHLNCHCCHKKIENKEIKKENINENNKENNKENKIKNEMDNKTVDEIYNYINDNGEYKTRKKKKNKKKKKINIIKEIDKNKINEEIEDSIVKQFKQYILENMIDANHITKIKPVVSENFLNIISNKY